MQPLKRPKIGYAVYIIPNLITTGNLFFGFFSIVKCLQNDFAWAAAAIFLAAIFDVLDGRVARMTRGTSEFGVQYDSLCDLVSFGLAPAFLMYQFGLRDFGRIGWIVCFLFLACGTLRLARFNVLSGMGKSSNDFVGLPIPMAAIVVATFVALVTDVEGGKSLDIWPIGILAEFLKNYHDIEKKMLLIGGPALSALMVSSISYRSTKALNIKGVRPFKLLAGLVAGLSLIAYHPEFWGFVVTITYALTGPVERVLGWRKSSDDDDVFPPNEGDGDGDGSSDEHREFPN